MGNNVGRNGDGERLIPAYTQMFQNLKLVLIGCHGARKNDVGNLILNKHAFTWWTTWSKTYVKGKQKTSHGKVTVYRAPGWPEGESPDERTQCQIRKCLEDATPHAIILVIKVHSSFKGIKDKILNNIFDSAGKFWEYTIVVFTCGETLDVPVENYIKINDINIPKDHDRRVLLNSDLHHSRLIELLEDMITQQKSMYFRFDSNGRPEEFIDYLKNRIAQLKRKIKGQAKVIESQNETIKKLKENLEKKIEELGGQSTLQQQNENLQKEKGLLQQTNKELKQENQKLREEKELLQQTNKELHQVNQKLREEKDTLQQLNENLQQEKESLQQPPKFIVKHLIQLKSPDATRAPTTGVIEMRNVPTLEAEEFVDNHRADLISKVCNVMPIADVLLSKKLIQSEKYAEVRRAPTNQESMRELYESLDSAGKKAKEAFYEILQQQEPELVKCLGLTLG